MPAPYLEPTVDTGLEKKRYRAAALRRALGHASAITATHG